MGVAYMCLALLTLMLLSMVMGLGLVRFLVEEPVHLQERLYFDYREPHPSAVLDFGVEEYDKLVKSVPVGHSCNVRLVFVMPESDYNREIGMFQVCTMRFIKLMMIKLKMCNIENEHVK